MLNFINEEFVSSFLLKFGIDYLSLSSDTKALCLILANITLIIIISMAYTIGRRIIYRIF